MQVFELLTVQRKIILLLFLKSPNKLFIGSYLADWKKLISGLLLRSSFLPVPQLVKMNNFGDQYPQGDCFKKSLESLCPGHQTIEAEVQ